MTLQRMADEADTTCRLLWEAWEWNACRTQTVISRGVMPTTTPPGRACLAGSLPCETNICSLATTSTG